MHSQYSKRETFEFGTKALTLERLKGYDFSARLCDQIVFDFRQWLLGRDGIIDQAISKFQGRTLIVRSSNHKEDTDTSSMAGAYESVLNVPCRKETLTTAIGKVFGSYGSDCIDTDQVLIQPMVENVSVSGVVFSADIATGAPYIVINYDDFSGRTDTVTSGAQSKLIYLRRGGEKSLRSGRFRKLVDVVYAIERITGKQAVDIEFCIDADDVIYLLQVRPLTVPNLFDTNRQERFHDQLVSLETVIKAKMPAQPGVVGSRTIFGEMPDWNPAEIIGRTPTPMATSFYKKLITDDAWHEARTSMGYRPAPHSLMHLLDGHPYIDVRLSFNSFLPAIMADNLAARIIDEQIDFLSRNVDLHDKVEFEVAMTVWDFDLESRLNRLRNVGMSEAEIQTAERLIREHTFNILEHCESDTDAELAKVDHLTDLLSKDDSLNLFEILDMTRAAGTIPFSILARHAFIAVAILKSLVTRGALTEAQYSSFLNSISTVTTDFVNDGIDHANGRLDRETFLERYGHLRPGTYDIRVESYAEAPDVFLTGTFGEKVHHPEFSLTAASKSKIDNLLVSVAAPINSDRLFAYARTAIAGRERAKFCFSRGINSCFNSLLKWGNTLSLPREDLAFLTLDDVAQYTAGDQLCSIIARNRQYLNDARNIRLPSLISAASDCDVVRVPLGKPTFVSGKRVSGPTILLSGGKTSADISGRIVVIESADPGFDWIFAHRILGLVTKFGGANSHMAIRCAEFGLPAAIGCGERTFDAIVAAGRVELDCGSDTIRLG